MARRDRVLVGLRDREGDEEQGHADPVVQAALDVQPLTNADGQAWIRDDGLPERRVRRREHDRQHQRLRPQELTEEHSRDDRAREDRQRQPDSEQARGQRDFPAQRHEVDPRGVGEQHERERRLGKRAHAAAVDREVEPAQDFAPHQQAGADEQHRSGEDRPLEPSGQPRIPEHECRDDRQAPGVQSHAILYELAPVAAGKRSRSDASRQPWKNLAANGDRTRARKDNRRAMDAPPLVEAKLAAPRVRRGVLDRPRILHALDADAVLTLVGAPAGYGKTTAVRIWCATRDAALAWVTLDAGDNDPGRMWTYVATAVDRIRPGLGLPALRRLGAAGSPIEHAVDELMSALGGFGEPVILVLDDLHAVTEQDCLASLDHALLHVPENVRVIVSTRDRPGARAPPAASGAKAHRAAGERPRLYLL